MFSEKYGYKPEKTIQHERISDELRYRIWNLFYQCEIKAESINLDIIFAGEPTVGEKIADRMGFVIDRGLSAEEQLRNNILGSFAWFEVYDFIDIYLAFLSEDQRAQRIKQYNEVFAQEKAGYRIVAGEVAPITNESEIQCVESAAITPYQSVNQHVRKALSLYADIKSPDYENSVKESISAVEAMCCIITGMTGSKATLGNTLNVLEKNGVHIHGAMKNAFSSLYGYTSDENGIRHGGIEFKDVPAEDAKYMLVSCSAFVNYLIEKWSKVNS